MNNNEKQKMFTRVAYIVLSIMTLTILCVTIYTFIGSFKKDTKKNTEPPLSTTESTEKPKQNDVFKPDKETDRKTETKKPDKNQPEETKPTGDDKKDNSKEVNAEPENPKLIMPVDGKLAKAHEVETPVYSVTMNDYRTHCGVDIEAPIGSDVLCSAYGKVKSITNDPFEGCCVVIDHGNGVMTYYKNLAAELAQDIKVDATVNQGQKIGIIGETAAIEIADPAHLHFEVSIDGKKVNPEKYLSTDNSEKKPVETE